ncbi:MAG: hypothetical protein AAF226_17995, partial [Verrucomicrobiota bacterium]
MNFDASKAVEYREALGDLKELMLANVVMAGELPAPTGGEDQLVTFLRDRFMEGALNHVSVDEAGNAAAIVDGKSDRYVLVAAHLDKIWSAKEDHTVSVTESE